MSTWTSEAGGASQKVIDEAIAVETAAREAADASEAGIRAAADEELAGLISSEADARLAADAALSSDIAAVTGQVQSMLGNVVSKSGDTMTGLLKIEDGSGNPIAIVGASSATHKLYVDQSVNAVELDVTALATELDAEIQNRIQGDNALSGQVANKLSKSGDTVTGFLNLVDGLGFAQVPTDPKHAANKAYVDSVGGTQYIDNSTTNETIVQTQYVDNSTTVNSVVQPGEIRSFAGDVPAGWEKVGDIASNLFDHSFAATVGPTELGAVAFTTTTGVQTSRRDGSVWVGASKIIFSGNPAGTAANDYIVDLNAGSIVTGLSRQQSQFNISARTNDGKALYSGGMTTGSAAYTGATFTIDEFGAQTSYAACPVTGAGGAGTRISDTEYAFFSTATSTGLGTNVNLASYKFNISTNSWSLLASSPRSHISGAAMKIGSLVYVFGSENIADGGIVDVYDPAANTWSVAAFGLPAGIDAIRGVTKARLANGNYVILAKYTSENGAAAWVQTEKLFIVTATGIQLGPNLPGAMNTVTNITNFADNGLTELNAPMYLLRGARTTTVGLERGLLMNETTQQFLSKKTIKYARKL